MTRFATFAGVLLAATSMAGAQEIQWRKDYQVGIKEAKASGKLVMLDFFTEW